MPADTGIADSLGRIDTATHDLVPPVDGSSGNAPRLTAGYFHTCALWPDGRIKCWGVNESGQLGYGHIDTLGDEPGEMGASLPFVDLGPNVFAQQIGAGHQHTCALTGDGQGAQVKCWGQGVAGNLGNESQVNVGDQPGEMTGPLVNLKHPSGLAMTRFVVQKRNVCIIYSDNSLRCNGQNDYGQLGIETFNAIGNDPGEMGDSQQAVMLGTGLRAMEVVVGDYHACALVNGGKVKCWGRGHYGRLGLGDTKHRGGNPGDMGDSLPFVQLGANRSVTALFQGYFGNCAQLDDGTYKCWGGNKQGELGLGHTNNLGDGAGEMGDALPTVSPGAGRTIVAIRGGYHFYCLILADRTLRCAGNNADGQLGLGNAEDYGDQPGETWANLEPIDLGKGRTLRTASLDSLAVGLRHVCAVLDDETVKCWGNNMYGQLGLGDTENRGDGPGEMSDNLPAVVLR